MDRQTDGIAIAYARLQHMLSRAKRKLTGYYIVPSINGNPYAELWLSCRWYRNNNFTYYMENQALDVVTDEKDLGVNISSNLKPTRQCQLAYAKAGKALGLIAQTISYKSVYVLLRLYKSLVRPHLEYSASAWSPSYEKDKIGLLLERIQHRFTRMIPGYKNLPYEERLRKTDLWTLEERRNRADL